MSRAAHRTEKRTGRVLISIAVVLIMLTSAVWLFGDMLRNRPKVAERPIIEPSYNVDVFEVTPIDFREMLSAFGTAQADREVVLSAQVTGEIVALSPQLRVGRAVSASRIEVADGSPSERISPDLLMRIDPRDYQARVEQSQATIDSSRTEIEQLNQQNVNLARQLELGRQDMNSLKDEYGRIQSLRDRGAGSASDLTRALLEMRRYEDTMIQLENQISLIPHQVAAAQQRQASAETEQHRAQNDLERTSVTAPFSGIVGDVMVEQGQYVRAGEPLLRLVDPERIEVPVALGMEDYLTLQDTVHGGEFPEALLAENESSTARWNGRVVRVAPDADAASRTIQVFIEVMNSEQQMPLLPGTFVFGWIEGPQFTDAVIIPRTAIVDNRVFVVGDENRAEPRSVRVGRRLRSLVVIEDGLQAGDRVILTNLDIVRNHTLVAPQEAITIDEELARQRVATIQRINVQPPL
jgi:RND family efflux transporter MFP subunit